MKTNYLNSYSTEAILQAFYSLGSKGFVIIPKTSDRLIRDIKVHIGSTLGVNYEEVEYDESRIAIQLKAI